MRTQLAIISRLVYSMRWPARSKPIERGFELLGTFELSSTFWLTVAVLLGALMVGGGTRSGLLSDALLQLISIPPLLIAVARIVDLPLRSKTLRLVKFALIFCAALILLPLLQVIRLPSWLWALLPNRAPQIAVFAAIGHSPGWMPISISPNATMLSALSLLPPLAVFLGSLLLGYRERRLLSLLIVAFAIISSFVGLLQFSQGPSSPLRLYAITNTTEAVGFFANRNHFGALLYAALPFAAVWAVNVCAKAGPLRGRQFWEARSIVPITSIFLAFVIILAGEAVARSRAGMLLTMVALFGVYLLIVVDRRKGARIAPAGLILAAASLVVLIVVQLALYRVLQTFTVDPLQGSRLHFLRNTMEAAWAYLPFGSGVGTFVPVYGMFERPVDALAQYVNRAHNDFAEMFLETGLFGMSLLGLFSTWFISRTLAIWFRPWQETGGFDCLLGRAGTLVIVLFGAHSLVDYPMRTGAITGVFALACALMFAPLSVDDGRRKQAQRVSRDLIAAAGRRPATPRIVSASPRAKTADALAAEKTVPAALARWGEEIDWPQAWRKASQRKALEGSQTAAPSTAEEPEPK